MKTKINIANLRLISLTAYIILGSQITNSQLYAQHQHHPNKITAEKNIYIAIMDTMMADMHNIILGNTPDIAFLQQMIPHHEGAIAMAKYEIAHGKSIEMIHLAKSIVAKQKKEITQMQLWLKQVKPARAKLPESFRIAIVSTMDTMMGSMPKETELNTTDRAFAAVMKPHHQAAIDMAKVLLKYSSDPIINTYANQLTAKQQAEVSKMSQFLSSK